MASRLRWMAFRVSFSIRKARGSVRPVNSSKEDRSSEAVRESIPRSTSGSMSSRLSTQSASITVLLTNSDILLTETDNSLGRSKERKPSWTALKVACSTRKFLGSVRPDTCSNADRSSDAVSESIPRSTSSSLSSRLSMQSTSITVPSTACNTCSRCSAATEFSTPGGANVLPCRWRSKCEVGSERVATSGYSFCHDTEPPAAKNAAQQFAKNSSDAAKGTEGNASANSLMR
mmetsp:Transcript_57729/g.153905  ORF Transcript_57729/g.153905 Transcript_57729/m.153905 type:complete len:232 (+) Transcript_57729:272-967(+)